VRVVLQNLMAMYNVRSKVGDETAMV